MKNLVIIGGSDAGISAALRAREIDPRVQPVMIVADAFPNFSICGLPYFIGGDVTDWRTLAHRTAGEIEAAGIRLLTEHTARSIDTGSRRVTVDAPGGKKISLDYDALVIATGAVSVRPPLPGLDSPGVFFLRWMRDSFAINDYIRDARPTAAVIIGAGYIGMEMSESLARRGMKVTIVEAAPSVMPSMEPALGAKIADALASNGISVHTGTGVESITRDGGGLVVHGTAGFRAAAGLVLVSVGGAPNTELGRSIGMETGVRGALRVTRKMESGIPGVYAAGDCVETRHRMLRDPFYLPLGTVAHKQGRVAGENAAGGDAEFAGSLGTQSVKIFDTVAARTGLNEREARGAGLDPVSADFEGWDHKAYYPGAKKIFIRVTADTLSGKILGAQMLGAYGTEVSKRIDIFAAALYHEMTVREFSNYDLSYTPPLSSPWDPVQTAVQHLERTMKK
ncbi:MAG: CoA-disulfide reductase [Spirochaetes bacterium]|nr:MAG: CoA-disulfide reductase [Spirochaetota bacterium]